MAYADVTLHGLRKRYGRQTVLAGVDARFSAGQISVLMGANGAGKSTLVGIVSTLLTASAGRIDYGESGRWTSAALRRTIGYLAHRAMLYPDLTLRENLRLFADLYGIGDRKRVESVIGRVAMTEAADRAIREYSRGMTQRASLARAILHEPHLVLLDEPFSGLDQQGVAFVRGLLQELREQGRIVIVVSHDFQALDGICDQQIVLHRGHVAMQRLDDTPISLDALVAGYHGSTRKVTS